MRPHNASRQPAVAHWRCFAILPMQPGRDWRSLVHTAEANRLVLDEEKAHRIDAAQWARRPQSRRWKEALAQRFELFL